jgi:virginiamycin B lyase
LEKEPAMKPAGALFALLLAAYAAPARADFDIKTYDLPKGTMPHDVAPSPEKDGPVWYCSQPFGVLGRLDPVSGAIEQIPLGRGSAPHGVIVGPDGAPWLTDGGQNAIVRVDPKSKAVKLWKLPENTGYANLNTAAFDAKGRIWFTGQSGIYGRLDPAKDDIKVWKAPRGYGPYGIAATREGRVFYASLAGSYIAEIETESGAAKVIDPPTKEQGARRVWPDSQGRIWVSEWNSGQLSRFDPILASWAAWKLPGQRPRAYAVYVDEMDMVWVSEWAAQAMTVFDPKTEGFTSFPSDKPNANVRQILGRQGEVWAPESGADRLVVYRRR